MAQLEFPDVKHERMIKDYIDECLMVDGIVIGDGGCSLSSGYQTWLKKSKEMHLGINLEVGFVPATTFFYQEDNQIIGIINIRHCLNGYLFNQGGHIGYSVLPSRRKQGIASKMLKLAIEYCMFWDIKPILVTCKKENIASKKTIEKCGGKLENEYYDKNNKETFLRFWIGEKND